VLLPDCSTTLTVAPEMAVPEAVLTVPETVTVVRLRAAVPTLTVPPSTTVTADVVADEYELFVTVSVRDPVGTLARVKLPSAPEVPEMVGVTLLTVIVAPESGALLACASATVPAIVPVAAESRMLGRVFVPATTVNGAVVSELKPALLTSRLWLPSGTPESVYLP
jgi:hypothetical protein